MSGVVERCSPFRYPRVARLAEVAARVISAPDARLAQMLARVRAELLDAELPVFAPYSRALVEALVVEVRRTGRKSVELVEALRDVEEELGEQAPIARPGRG